MSNLYLRLCKNIYDYGELIPADNIQDKVTSEREWYSSIFYYNEQQYQTFLKKKSIKGVRDVVTNKLVFDFDHKEDPDFARTEAKVLVHKLVKEAHIPEKDIEIYFSGNKGFHVIITLDTFYSPDEIKAAAFKLTKGLKLDCSLYDPPQLLRIPGTLNQATNLYKIPLTHDQLLYLSLDEIKQKAEDLENVVDDFSWSSVTLSKDYFIVEDKPDLKIGPVVDMSNKPKFLTNCRWYLQNGNFGSGERNNALLCLCATYKNIGFDLEHTYRLLKGVAELQARKTGQERYSDDEVYNNIIMQVYTDSWQGGQFTCKQAGWLNTFCKGLGDSACKHEEEKKLAVKTDEIFGLFQTYVDNFEKNVLFTGIPSLDRNVKLLVGTSNALLASPGVGKSSLSLQILNHNSNLGVPCLFFSYDMFHASLLTRMIQRMTGLDLDTIFSTFKQDDVEANNILSEIKEQYKNVNFCFKSGQTPEDMINTIDEVEARTGEKIKLVIVDYNELVITDKSDATAASAEIAQRMRQIANDKQVCVLSLLQPSKMFSSPADDITNYNAAKGSSAIVQSLTVMMGASRPGFNPKNIGTDNFMNITCLKNRNGPLFSLDFKWNGLKGLINEMDDEDREELKYLREAKASKEEGGGWS